MADQTTVERFNGVRDSAPRAAARNMADLIHDLVTLAELQWRLLSVDSRQALGRIVPPIVMVVVAAMVGLSCVPLAFVAVALTLAAWTSLSLAACFWITLAAGLIVAGILFAVALGQLKSVAGVFDRSKAELRQNVEWLKGMLRRLSHRSDETATGCGPAVN